MIDGISNSSNAFLIKARYGDALDINPITGKIYAAFSETNDVAVITEQQVQNIPIKVTIHPLPDNRTDDPNPSFTFTAKDTFRPQATRIDQFLFQVDTRQGQWQTAKNKGSGNFEGTVQHALGKGMHILYAYATDGQAATSTNTGMQSGPLIGNIQGYMFLVY